MLKRDRRLALGGSLELVASVLKRDRMLAPGGSLELVVSAR
ncbi:MAG TPA: hypothetical protein VFS00_03690 [Polyangiaceae bacterium]|nr:hypothetical protein [Polyangiaceae bacterium]